MKMENRTAYLWAAGFTIAVLGTYAYYLWNPPPATQTRSWNEYEERTKIGNDLKKLMDAGLIKEIDCKAREIFVDEIIWAGTTAKNKETVTSLSAFYCVGKNGSIDVKGYHNGRTLASWGPLSGFKVAGD